jgi:branched-chain amino acid transport system substrate-binding protein
MGKLRRTAVAAVAVSALVMSACASSGTSSSGSNTPIKIGVLLPLSGPLAAAAKDYGGVVNAIKAGKDPKFTKIDGRPVEVTLVDDTGTAAGAASAARQLMDQTGVDVMLGPLYTGMAQATLPLVTAKKMLDITFTGCPDCGDGTKNPTVFSIEYDRPMQGPATITRLKALGKDKMGMIQSDDVTGADYANAIQAAAKDSNVPVSPVVKFTPASLDLSAQVSQLKNANVDTVYVASAVPSDVANIIKAMKELNYKPTLLGNAALGGTPISAAVGNDPEWLNRMQAAGFSPNFMRPNVSDAAQKFHDQIKTDFGETGDVSENLNQSAVVEDGFTILKAAIEGTHKTDGPTLAKYLEKNGVKGLRANYTFTSTKHNGFNTSDVGWQTPGTVKDGFGTAAPVGKSG